MHVPDGAQVRDVRVGEDALQAVDGALREGRAREGLAPLVQRPRHQLGLQQRDEAVAVAHAKLVGGEVGVGGEVAAPDALAELTEEAVVAAPDRHPAVFHSGEPERR